MKEIFINKQDHISKILLVENGNLVEKYEEDERVKRLEGKIYIGKVQNVLQGMQAAFIDIGEERNTFIHLKDILPKVNIVKNPDIKEETNIKKLIKLQDKILIQVKRDATNIKGAKVSTHISIPSRYFVLMPDTDIRTISQKIENKDERERLQKFIDDVLPESFGVIIRTSAQNQGMEILQKDLNEILDIWKNIQKSIQDENSKAPVCIYEGQTFIEKLLIDLCCNEVERIVVNNKTEYDKVIETINKLEENIKVELIEDENILKIYDIEEQLDKSELRKIWLRCGGFITIDKTEALTAIDVNSGRYIGRQRPRTDSF